jgi:hypothetical protein
VTRHPDLRWAAVAALALSAWSCGPAFAAAGAPAAGAPAEQARRAKALEDEGRYGDAAAELRSLRGRVPPDADLDFALALDLARAGAPDSARAVLEGPVLSAALADSCPPARRRPYGPGRDALWTDGRYEGWRWYILRAWAEVDARLGRWDEARDASRLAVMEHPLAGREWLVAAVCSGRAGDLAGAEHGARLAAYLDPMLPEAQYLVGLFEWRAGRRPEALRRFAAAVALDSLYQPAVRARQRLRFFPGAAPDSLPAELLTGVREAGLLTSAAGPKLESPPPLDKAAVVLQRTMVPVPESLQVQLKPVRMVLHVLVDERGRAILCELPWLAPEDLPPALVAVLLESLPGWRFAPALQFGRPVRAWTAVNISTGG